MWWLLVPVVVAGGAALARALSSDDSHKSRHPRGAPPNPNPRPDAASSSVFRANLLRLQGELLRSESRPVAVMGAPGAGKSSLIDLLTHGECEPRPVIGQKTDATDWSRDDDVPLLHRAPSGVFVDLPGIDTERHALADLIDLFPFDLVGGVVIVQKGKVWGSTARLLAHVRQQVALNVLRADRVLIVRTFIDALDTHEEIEEVRADLERIVGSALKLYLVSNRTKVGIDELRADVAGFITSATDP
jgi:GTPase Era involved in 16S rRNA processing